MSSTLEFAEVRSFSASGDVAGLLRALRPDALIVDSDAAAKAAAEFATNNELPVIHICVRGGTLRLFRGGEWEQISNCDGPTPEAIRNVIAGALFARGSAAR